MTTIEIHNTKEAKQKLGDALNILDAISAYSINHQIPDDQLFDTDVRRRLQRLHPKPPPPNHPLLEQSNEFSADEITVLSPYCYKIEDLANFDDVLGDLEAHYNQMNAQASKGELIDSIIRSGLSKTVRSAVAGILDVIGSLALWRIREIEARTLATERGHTLVTQEDKSNAATEMWRHLSTYNRDADRAKLDARVRTGIRWNKFVKGKDVGIIVVVHKLPPSLKSHFVKLASIVDHMPKILDRAKRATPCVQMVLDSRLGPWEQTKKRKLLVGIVIEPSSKHQRSNDPNRRQGPNSSARISQTQQQPSIQSEHNQTSGQATNFQYRTPLPVDRGDGYIHSHLDASGSERQDYAYCRTVPSCAERDIFSDPTNLNPAPAAETLVYLSQGTINDTPQGVGTTCVGKDTATVDRNQGTEQASKSRPLYSPYVTDKSEAAMTFSQLGFDDLWTSSLDMTSSATFDDMWNSSQILQLQLSHPL